MELYDLEIHQKKAGLVYHRLETMVKRSIEQNLRKKNFDARNGNGNYETNAVVKSQGTKQREQRSLGDCWQWEANGQCVKRRQLQFPPRYEWAWKSGIIKSVSEFILSCGRVSENHRGPEVPEVKVPAVECCDGLARITLEELAITHFVKNGTLQNACSTKTRMVAVLGKVLIRTSSG